MIPLIACTAWYHDMTMSGVWVQLTSANLIRLCVCMCVGGRGSLHNCAFIRIIIIDQTLSAVRVSSVGLTPSVSGPALSSDMPSPTPVHQGNDYKDRLISREQDSI